MAQNTGSDTKVLIWAAGVLGGFLVVGGVLFGVSLIGGGEDRVTARPTPSATPTRLPTRAPSTPTPSATPTDPYPTVAAMKNFVVQYLDTAVGSPAQGWRKLTPKFKRASGGFAEYRDYWSDITAADADAFEADTVQRTIAYTVRYRHRDGSTSTDSTRLQLTYTDGQFAIDGED